MPEGGQRLDKWLWFARFAKSRTLAAKLVTDGHVRLNGRRLDVPARTVRPGEVLTVAAPHGTAVVRIVSEGRRRGPPAEARTLYEEVGRDEVGRDDGALASREPGP